MRLGVHEFTKAEVSYDHDIETKSLAVDSIQVGLTTTDEFIIFRKNNSVKVYDRICDHNGGKLISNGHRTICPMHGWELDVETGKYLNVECEKKPLFDGDVTDIEFVEIPLKKMRRSLESFNTNKKITIRFLNHACLIINSGTLKFATDPWLVGSAFCNGWWLKYKTPDDAFAELNACDFIYISHNHPDHLHKETLLNVRRDMKIITANFQSGSTEKYLRSIGFKNVSALNFEDKWVSHTSETAISVMKSGDFRDDSGLLFECGDFSALLTVDSKYLDFWRLPSAITILASSFAGGATGFPLCFENYDPSEKQRIVTRNRNAAKVVNEQVISLTSPKAFLPYAGYFIEGAERDEYIRKNNKKNTVEAYESICQKLNVKLIDPIKCPVIHYVDGKFEIDTNSSNEFMVNENNSFVPQAEKVAVNFDDVKLYFENSHFHQELDLHIVLTDDVYKEVFSEFCVKFNKTSAPQVLQKEKLDRREGVNYLKIVARIGAFEQLISQYLPWEDMLIGFQCRVYREPNVYNSAFWFHFTNTYINVDHKRQLQECSNCNKLNQILY